MPWPAVNTDEIKDRWRPLTAAERPVAEKRVLDAEAELRRELRLRGLTGTPTFDTVEERNDWTTLYVATVAEMVRRYLGNTEGILEEREQLDDYSRTKRRDATTSSGRIYVDAAEIDRLVPTPRRKKGAFSIVLGQS